MRILSSSSAQYGVSDLTKSGTTLLLFSRASYLTAFFHIGAFDIISEFFPHVAIVLYRVYPDRHHFLSRVFLLSCITTATGTLCETIVTMWLFGSLWNRWEIAFKVATPILHIAFSAAQIHGSIVFWRMYKKQRRYMLEEKEVDIVREMSVDSHDPLKPQRAFLSV